MQILFLGYDRQNTGLIDFLESRGHDVQHTGEPVTDLSGCDLAISFGYRHILRADALATVRRPILNLHMAYLPYNRGAHPVFWSIIDQTPMGVTIHEIDEGVDTGAVCFQREVKIPTTADTFAGVYKVVRAEMEALFIENADALLNHSYAAKPQSDYGTFHSVADLPEGVDWRDGYYARAMHIRRELSDNVTRAEKRDRSTELAAVEPEV